VGARRRVARCTAGGGHLTCWSGLLRFQMVHAATAAADAEQPQLGRSSAVGSTCGVPCQPCARGGRAFLLAPLPPRGSNRLRCSRSGSCSTRRSPSVCCFQRTRRWESTKAAPLLCKSPPLFRNSAATPKVHFKPPAGQWARGRGQRGPIIVRGGGEGAPPLSSRWRARPRPKVSAHPFLRRQQRSNKSAASCRTRCACARHGAGAHGGRGCAWGVAELNQGTRRAKRLHFGLQLLQTWRQQMAFRCSFGEPE